MPKGLRALYTHMSKAPTPINKNPWLPSKGYDETRATRHRFVKAVETVVEEAPGEWDDVWQFIFACQETGVERVFGYASRNMPDVPFAKDN